MTTSLDGNHRQLTQSTQIAPVDFATPPPSAESVEGRGLTEENAEPLLLDRTQGRKPRSRGLFGVREAAQRDK
ncbi:MAG: hypothetical protein WA798_09250, partial [Candidatus Acidiferrum sp.]